ncbi:MAG TPA: BrnA antitoxin family protein [Stellaceae bacterium]|nr:BrnA antitoxin family protein [Stellaceae bacterium]
MTENKRVIHTDLAKLDAHEIQPEEYEDIPELTDEFFDKADFYIGDQLIRRGRGRPPLEAPKKLVSLRLDRDVIEEFRAGGPGWQSRINAALRRHLWGE